MAGYIGSKTSVTQVDGYNRTEADDEFVNDPNSVITVSGSNVGIGTSSPSRRLHVKESGSFVATFEGGTNAYTSWVNSTGGAGYIGSANGLGSGGLTDLAVRSENNLIFLTNAGSEAHAPRLIGQRGYNIRKPIHRYYKWHILFGRTRQFHQWCLWRWR